MHINLIRYIVKEINKKKSPKTHILFFKSFFIQYSKMISQQINNLFKYFDKDFRLQKKKYEHIQQLKKDLQRALKLLKYIDKNLAKIGKSRHERRQFWRDFFKDEQVRAEVFNQLENELK